MDACEGSPALGQLCRGKWVLGLLLCRANDGLKLHSVVVLHIHSPSEVQEHVYYSYRRHRILPLFFHVLVESITLGGDAEKNSGCCRPYPTPQLALPVHIPRELRIARQPLLYCISFSLLSLSTACMQKCCACLPTGHCHHCISKKFNVAPTKQLLGQVELASLKLLAESVHVPLFQFSS